MGNNNSKAFDSLTTKYLKIRRRLPNKLAIVAVNFFKRNFKVGGYVDTSFTKWKDSGKKNRKTLVNTGNLRRSIKKIYSSIKKVVVGVTGTIPYAQIHNEGGKIEITPKMRRNFWYMYGKTGDVKYKAMALTPKTHIDIPQRQFIGEDNKAIEIALDREIIRQFKTLKP